MLQRFQSCMNEWIVALASPRIGPLMSAYFDVWKDGQKGGMDEEGGNRGWRKTWQKMREQDESEGSGSVLTFHV